MEEQKLEITDQELQAVERRLISAFANRSTDGLNTLGFGEIGVPLAWPDDNPRLCLKRLNSSKSQQDIDAMLTGVQQYIDAAAEHVTVVPTELRAIDNDHKATAIYMVQPIIQSELLLENILANTAPVVDHPAIVALRDLVVASIHDRKIAIDSQVSNFAWDEGKLSFFDVGTPFRVNDRGEAQPLPKVMLATMPALLRSVGSKEARKIIDKFSSVRGNLEHASLSVARLGLDNWIEPVVETFNKAIDGEPFTSEGVRQVTEDRHKDMGTLKNLMKIQRLWAEKVRREPYDFFITDSFTGNIL